MESKGGRKFLLQKEIWRVKKEITRKITTREARKPEKCVEKERWRADGKRRKRERER